tara:strand:- start:1236 stop:1760 length:525 start_codon:yes stop_codon:yes gene_type:complete
MNYDKLSNEQIKRYLSLLHEEEIYQRLESLKNPTPEVHGPNYICLHDAIENQEWGFDDDGKPVLLNGVAGQILEGSSRCFIGTQKVITSKGSKPISEITVSDNVLTFNEHTKKDEFKPVIDSLEFKQNKKKCIKITLKNGETIQCSEDHEFYYEGSWLSIKHIVSLWNDSKNKY